MKINMVALLGSALLLTSNLALAEGSEVGASVNMQKEIEQLRQDIRDAQPAAGEADAEMLVPVGNELDSLLSLTDLLVGNVLIPSAQEELEALSKDTTQVGSEQLPQ